MRAIPSSRKNERGVTILIVALSLLALVAMAALAIDVANLYVAQGEARRAADAAALAGARMFVTSSFTSMPGNSLWTDTSRLCQSSGSGSSAAANRAAEAAAANNVVAGQPAQVAAISCDFTRPGNPQITVHVQSLGVPTFFAKIWGRRSGAVRAVSTAEAYNASGQTTPIRITDVKPWLIPNCNPNTSSSRPEGCIGSGSPPPYFINPANGGININGAFIGKSIEFSRQPTGQVGGAGDASNAKMQFYGLQYPDSPAPLCPSAGAVSCGYPIGASDSYINNVACTSRLSFSCRQQIGPGLTPEVLVRVQSPMSSKPTIESTKCLIHADDEGPNEGQDSFLGVPAVIQGGNNNPNPSLHVNNISRSDSVVTVPVYDGHQMCFDSPAAPPHPVCNSPSPTPATIIGFLQLGIQHAGSGGTMTGVVLNAVGCSPGTVYPPTNPVSGGGVFPIPVRLIQTP